MEGDITKCWTCKNDFVNKSYESICEECLQKWEDNLTSKQIEEYIIKNHALQELKVYFFKESRIKKFFDDLNYSLDPNSIWRNRHTRSDQTLISLVHEEQVRCKTDMPFVKDGLIDINNRELIGDIVWIFPNWKCSAAWNDNDENSLFIQHKKINTDRMNKLKTNYYEIEEWCNKNRPKDDCGNVIGRLHPFCQKNQLFVDYVLNAYESGMSYKKYCKKYPYKKNDLRSFFN